MFDNVLPSQLQPDSFIRDVSLTKLDEKSTVHILKKLGLQIDFNLNFRQELEIELKVLTSPVLIYLK